MCKNLVSNCGAGYPLRWIENANFSPWPFSGFIGFLNFSHSISLLLDFAAGQIGEALHFGFVILEFGKRFHGQGLKFSTLLRVTSH